MIRKHIGYMEKTKERISLILDFSVMFLSLQMILSFVSAAIVCAILVITSGFESWSVIIDPRYLKVCQ